MNQSFDSLNLAKQLIGKESITPSESGCFDLITNALRPFGFKFHHFQKKDVHNLWCELGSTGPLLCFAGHVDVVPPGPLDAWETPPFKPSIRNNHLFGRGAADMKSSIAAFVVACQNYLTSINGSYNGSIALLITSDEEGPAVHGTQYVIQKLQEQGRKIDYCLVGEPTSDQRFGDTIKPGRRGSLSGKLTLLGKQGHVAYPEAVCNPIHRIGKIIDELSSYSWDKGHGSFPSTSFQMTSIQSGVGANNVVPGELSAQFNFRFSPASSPKSLKSIFETLIKKHHGQYRLTWALNAEPFFSDPGRLTQALTTSIKEVTGFPPITSTGGGTSDGRFIKDICKEVIEFGPLNESIHQVNENINIDDLSKLTLIYQKMLEYFFKN